MILVFSHKLTDIQIKSGNDDLKIQRFEYLPPELQYIWSHIPPNEEDISPYLEGVIQWIDSIANKEDIVLVQGDFGATYKVVNHCKSKELKVVYSTTDREAIEMRDDEGAIYLQHKIRHIMFREY